MKLTKEELSALIESHRADSLGVEDGELTNERAIALDRYHGRPYGNEMEGRSSVVSKDLSEAVDWVMPAVMRIFTNGKTVATFDPVGPEDEQQAELETAYVNQVIMKDNQGWLVLHDAIKDTLLLKNGYVKHYWDETKKVETVEYQGLVIEEVQKLLGDLDADGCEVKITGQDENIIQGPMGEIPVYDLKLNITRKEGKAVIEATPTEEVRVSRKCRGSLQTSPFVEHVTIKTRSDLIEMGMNRDFVDQLPSYVQSNYGNAQSLSRDSVADESSQYLGTSVNDRSMDEIEYCEAYVKVDWDGDGVAELRRVVTVGKQIPDGEEWNKAIPEVALTGFVAKRVPHRHVGESLYDDLGDVQEIKTTLLRQLLDNIYLINNSEKVVNERVNIGDLMESTPGGIKRVEGLDPVAGAIMPLVTPNMAGDILPVVDYIDGIKESRTGITKASAGLDPDTLSNVTKGAFLENLNRASQKVEMITRMLCETGVRELVLRVHSLLTRYQDKQRMIRMAGKFVPINPQGWRERTDVTVNVGLGTGNEEDKQRKLMILSQLQRDILAPAGMVDPKQAHALFVDIAKTLGFDSPDKFAMSPDSPEFQQKRQQPPPPPPQVQVKQMELQADAQRFQAESQQRQSEKQAEMQMQTSVDQNRQEWEARQKTMEQQNLMALEQAKIQAADMQHQREMDFQRWKAELDAATKIQIANLTANQMNPATYAAMGEVSREIQP